MLLRRRRTTHPDRVRAHLDQHPGWWTADELATATGLDPAVAATAADRLVRTGRADVWSTAAHRMWASTRHGIR